MEKAELIDWKKFILLTGAVWLIQGLFSALNTGLVQQYSGNEVRWLAILIYSLSNAISWWLFTPIILLFIFSLRGRFRSVFVIGLCHLLGGVLITCLHRLVNIFMAFNLIKWTEAVDLSLLKLSNFFGINFIKNVANSIIVYFIIAGILFTYLFYLRSVKIKDQKAKIEADLSKLKLENLKYQFQPHFLFNSLQSVSTLMHRDLNAADQALGEIGDLLRHSIKTIDQEKITLGEELVYLQKYIDLQKTRYGDKLHSEIQIDEAGLDVMVPPFILQPLVENSIKHGVESSGSATRFCLTVTVDENNLVFTLTDNGKENELKIDPGHGTGLNNLRSRISGMYNGMATLNHGRKDTNSYQSTLSIPIDISTNEV